jgi:hypothetical protein
MKERIGALIGGTVEGMQWLGTFHSHRRAHPAPARRAGRAEIEFHDSRSGRSAAP